MIRFTELTTEQNLSTLTFLRNHIKSILGKYELNPELSLYNCRLEIDDILSHHVVNSDLKYELVGCSSKLIIVPQSPDMAELLDLLEL